MRAILTTTTTLLALGAGAQAQELTAQSYASSIGTSDAMIAGAERFEEASGASVTYNAIPSAGYNDAVNAAAAAGDLPDALMIDGPNVANYAWAGYIVPLDDYVDPALLADMTPAMKAQGTYGPDGKTYCIGPVDAGLSILGNRAYLEEAGVRIPTGTDDAWSREEFEGALAKLAALPQVDAPLDMKRNYGTGEWLTYAFSPIVQSKGGDLIDRETWTATGTMDGPAAVEALEMVKGWAENDWIVPAEAGDATFYGDKSAALSWVANWGVTPGEEGLGEDLVILPMPELRRGRGDRARLLVLDHHTRRRGSGGDGGPHRGAAQPRDDSGHVRGRALPLRPRLGAIQRRRTTPLAGRSRSTRSSSTPSRWRAPSTPPTR